MSPKSHSQLPGLADSLVGWCESVAAAIALPGIDHVYLPPPQLDGEKSRKFGLVVLDDHSTGFFYSLLEGSGCSGGDDYPADVLELARWYGEADIGRRAVGLGAIGAICQALFRRADFEPPQAVNPLADFDFGGDDHVGMVGYFPGLVDKLRRRGIRLTVLELDDSYLDSDDRFEVTLDPGRLAGCNKVLCTASTLINDTVDEVLANVGGAERVALIGPSAGCMPDPLFERGITVVGGSAVHDHGLLEARCDAGEDWGDAVGKYCLTAQHYPGTATLLDRLRRS